MERVLIVAPHPDDETLGAGGYLLKQKKFGNEVFVLNMTHISEEYGYSCERVRIRNNEIKRMCEAYKLDDYFNLSLKPAGLDRYDESEIIQKISCVIKKVKPTIVVLPFFSDVHSDHRITFNLCYSCTKTFRYPFIKKIMMMEIASETEYALQTFNPNYFVDVTEYIEQKIQVLNYFESEVGTHPFPRSEETIRANSIVRGAMACVKYAEAFIILKSID